MRIAFSGASGTGKTTLASFVSERFGVPVNPIGSRSVARAMGFDNPYDVDAAGRRAEFQRRLLDEKVGWEISHDDFVTDRTSIDDLTYSVLHGVRTIDARLVAGVRASLSRYTHVFYCPLSAFWRGDNDPCRVADKTYHEIYEVVLRGLIRRYLPMSVLLYTLEGGDEQKRCAWIESVLRLPAG